MSKETKGVNVDFMEDHIARNNEVYKHGVLTPKIHYQLVEDLHKYSMEAHIPEMYVYRSMLDFCEDAETDWMRSFKTHREKGCFGLCFVGGENMVTRMSAIVGCCLRNYISARLTTNQSLVKELKEFGLPREQLIAVPNFCLPKSQGGGVAAWELPLLLGMLYERVAEQKFTVIYTTSEKELTGQYGALVAEHVQKYFTII